MARWRHLLVVILLVPALVAYLAIMLAFSDYLTGYHVITDFLFYLCAGLAWIPIASRIITWLAKHEAH